MKTGDRIASVVFWVFGILVAVWVEYFAFVYIARTHDLTLTLAALFGLVCIGLGIRRLVALIRMGGESDRG